jgi:hypothetical protein
VLGRHKKKIAFCKKGLTATFVLAIRRDMNPLSQILSPSYLPKRCSFSTALLLSLVAPCILLSSVNVFAINHPPTVSWIKDQALSDQPGQQHSFETVYFRA